MTGKIGIFALLLIASGFSARAHMISKRQTSLRTDIFYPQPNYQMTSYYQSGSESRDNTYYVQYDSDHPEAYRWEPRSKDSSPNYVIREERLRKIRSEFMYWYFDKSGQDGQGNGDHQTDLHSSMSQIHKNFNFQLPFFGFRFNYTRLSMNGYLEFSDPPPFYTYPLSFPVKDWPKVNDPSFIGIFFSKTRIGQLERNPTDKRAPGVYFRMERDLQTRTDKFGVEMRERLTWDIREGMIGSDSFYPKHAVIVTWKNMSFAGGIGQALERTNTFQLVLATDEVYTYAIFNYLQMSWTTHTEANGDTTTGEGGTPAYVGFNAGNGTGSWSYYPYSETMTIRDLVGRGYVNGFPGRHIFRIDEKIMSGNCNRDQSGANLPLVFAPESGNMLGGTVVNITGPCFKKTDIVSCRFDKERITGIVVDANRAICIQPMILHEGYTHFSVSLNSGTYDYKGKFFIESPASATEKIFFTDRSVHSVSPERIKITWDKYNLTSNYAAEIRVSLWGYHEKGKTPVFEYINTVSEPGVQNTGEYEIITAKFRNNYDPRPSEDFRFGFLQINLTNPSQYSGLEISPLLWSKPIPLAWYFAPQWTSKYGEKWSEKMCNKWIMDDRFLKDFASNAPICPCTLKHALTDKARYLPDYDCDKDSNPNCYYNKGAIHCVRSGIPSQDASAQQCCYDKNGYLMLSYDQKWGSRPHRSHNLGLIPFDEANKVPSLSHWYHDMVPMYLCCLWQEDQAIGCETFRFERRPSQDCIAYQSPQLAAVFGDPHVITFDGLEYTFNGMGEFVLVKVDDIALKLEVQARFEQVHKNYYGDVKATMLTSIVAKGNSTEKPIEIRLRPPYAQWRYRLDVLVDNQKRYFDRSALKFQRFQDAIVYTPTYILNQSEVIIMFDSGAGIEVIENKGFMTARVYLPMNFMNKTKGLFGNWSHDVMDDFTKPDGHLAGISNLNDFRTIHNEFAIHWMLEEHVDSLVGGSHFYKTPISHANKSFVPEFKQNPRDILPSNRTEDIARAEELCGDNYQCKYDYAMSLDRDMAHFTKNYYDTVSQIRAINSERTVSCGILETPRFGRKSSFIFVPGAKVDIECNTDFVLVGDRRRYCEADGHWNIPEYGYAECLHHEEYSIRSTGWTFLIVGVILAPILIVGFWCLVRCCRDDEDDDSIQPPTGNLRKNQEQELSRIHKLEESSGTAKI